MNEKEKAKELVERFRGISVHVYPHNYPIGFDNKKICALIAVDEIINTIRDMYPHHRYGATLEYWQQVKEEILKL